MIYDNCIKYIYDEMDEISKKEDLKVRRKSFEIES